VSGWTLSIPSDACACPEFPYREYWSQGVNLGCGEKAMLPRHCRRDQQRQSREGGETGIGEVYLNHLICVTLPGLSAPPATDIFDPTDRTVQ